MLPSGQNDGWLDHFLIRKLFQEVMDTVEPRAFLIDRLNHPTLRLRYVRALQHDLLRLGVVLPPAARFEIHGTELPLLERVVDAAQKAHILLLVRNRETILQ